MSTAGLALVAAAAALAATVVMASSALRARRTSDRRLAQGLLEIGARMDALASELAQTVDRVREDGERARILGSLGQTLDLDEVVARCAEVATTLPGVAGAVVRVEVDGVPSMATAGLDARYPSRAGADPSGASRAQAGMVGGPPDGSPVRAVAISYHYPQGREQRTAVRSAIAVPIDSELGLLGFLTVFGRGDEPPVADAGFQTLESIARQTGSAIDTTRRCGAVAQTPAGDGLTGLGTRQLFHEALALEVASAHRRARRLSVCVLDLDDFRRTNGLVGSLAGDVLLVEIADLLRETSAPADLAYRIGGDEFGIILRDSGRIDAEGLFARLQGTLRRRTTSPVADLSLSGGIAELRPDDDGVTLFERAERALHRAKEAGKGTAA